MEQDTAQEDEEEVAADEEIKKEIVVKKKPSMPVTKKRLPGGFMLTEAPVFFDKDKKKFKYLTSFVNCY